MSKKLLCYLAAAACMLIISGCKSSGQAYYDNAVEGRLSGCSFEKYMFNQSPTDRVPVIFIHGLFGSELRDLNAGGKLCWGEFFSGNMLDKSMFYNLALPLDANGKCAELTPGGLLEYSRTGGFLIRTRQERYSVFTDMLKSMGYLPEKCDLPRGCNYSTLFVFCYDWRKSIDENAALLADFIEEKSAYLARQLQYSDRKQEVRFDLIGHSMGGLIARYYVQFGKSPLGRKGDPLPRTSWYGRKYVRNVIMISTPNGGYADTLVEMINGLKLSPLAPVFPAGVLAAFPSYFQMLPDTAFKSIRFAGSGENADIFDVALWKKYHWGLLKDCSENRTLLEKMYPQYGWKAQSEIVLENLTYNLERAGRFKYLMANPMGVPPEPLRFYCFASAGIRTAGKVLIDEDSGKITEIATVPGDGKVSFASAKFDSPLRREAVVWSGVTVLDGAHMGILRHPLLAYNLWNILGSGL